MIEPININSLGQMPQISKQEQIDKASTEFTAVFINQILKTSTPDTSLLTGEKKTTGEMMSQDLMNLEYARIIAEKSQIKTQIKQVLQDGRK